MALQRTLEGGKEGREGGNYRAPITANHCLTTAQIKTRKFQKCGKSHRHAMACWWLVCTNLFRIIAPPISLSGNCFEGENDDAIRRRNVSRRVLNNLQPLALRREGRNSAARGKQIKGTEAGRRQTAVHMTAMN